MSINVDKINFSMYGLNCNKIVIPDNVYTTSTNFSGKFANLQLLEECYIGGGVLNKITDMSNAFFGIQWATDNCVICGPNVTDMSNCYSLINDKVWYSGGGATWNAEIQDLEWLPPSLINGCELRSGTEVADIYGLGIYPVTPVCGEKVTSMSYAYAGRKVTQYICGDNVTDMSGTYSRLENGVITGYNLVNDPQINITPVCGNSVINMHETYAGCPVNTIVCGPKVTDISYGYYGCASATSLEPNNYHWDSVINADYMCYNCGNLRLINQTLYLNNVESLRNGFEGCPIGGNIVISSNNITNLDYAFIGHDDCTIYLSSATANPSINNAFGSAIGGASGNIATATIHSINIYVATNSPIFNSILNSQTCFGDIQYNFVNGGGGWICDENSVYHLCDNAYGQVYDYNEETTHITYYYNSTNSRYIRASWIHVYPVENVYSLIENL